MAVFAIDGRSIVSIKDKKMAVLHQLSQESEPISLSELREKLKGEHSERSIRRWLSEMITEGLVSKIGHKRATKYFVIGRAKRVTGKTASCFGSESTKIITRLRRPIYLSRISWKTLKRSIRAESLASESHRIN